MTDAQTRALIQALLDEHRPGLETLRAKAAGYFAAVSDGKVWRKAPAVEVTLQDPADGPGAPDARLVIQPTYVRRKTAAGWAVTVGVDTIHLTLFHLHPGPEPNSVEWRKRASLVLPAGQPARLTRWYPREVAADVGQLAAVVARFLADPMGAVAKSRVPPRLLRFYALRPVCPGTGPTQASG
jgi:hypothetical protein